MEVYPAEDVWAVECGREMLTVCLTAGVLYYGLKK